jgi:D-apionolactonase
VTTISAGALSAEVEGADLVSVRWGAAEIASRIQVTVRDGRWGTVPPAVRDLRVDRGADAVTARIEARHEDRDVAFGWTGVVEMRAGELSFALEGRALREFGYRRIGLCVLHPWRTYVGGRYRATTTDGAALGVFPHEIAPQPFLGGSYRPMIEAFSELHVELQDAIAFDMRLEGDLFELEDQRNWSDASFKTYATPLARSVPRTMRKGDVVTQRVTLRVAGPATKPEEYDGPTTIRVGKPAGATMPPVGVMLPPEPVPAGTIEALRALAPAHVRGDLLSPDVEALARLAERASEISAPLELALVVDEDADVSFLGPALREASLARLLVHLRSGATTPGEVATTVREQLGSAIAGVPVAGGTWSHFSELNRLHPDRVGVDEVALSISPQVHAFDERSMMETLEIQAQIVRGARAFSGRLPIVVSPVSLKPHEPGRWENDPRSAHRFGAAWTLGSVASLATAGAASLTYEPDGLLSAVVSMSGSDVLDVASSRPREVAALALRSERGVTLFLANLTPFPRAVDAGTRIELGGYATTRLELDPTTGVTEIP